MSVWTEIIIPLILAAICGGGLIIGVYAEGKEWERQRKRMRKYRRELIRAYAEVERAKREIWLRK